MSAYDAGFRAAFDGVPADANPFPSDTPSFEDWDNGHFDCTMENDEYSDEEYESDYDDSMDGDFDSAMTSAGFGTDEDYGDYGYDDDGRWDE